MRTATLDAHPGAAAALYQTLLRARRQAGEGNDARWNADGLAANRAALQTFLRYHHEQGLSPQRLTVDEMFAEETRSLQPVP